MSVPVLLKTCCFLVSALATRIQSHRSLETYDRSSESYGLTTDTENDDFTSENYIVPKDLPLYVSRIMFEIEKRHSGEMKELKAVIESQGRQIKALDLDKQTLTSAVNMLERRIDHLEEKKASQVEDDRGHRNRVRRAGTGSKVAFFAKMKAASQHLLKDETVFFGDVMTNIGNAYNGSSGDFVVPSHGTYVFSLTIGRQTGDDTYAVLMVNGKPAVKVIVSEEQSTHTVVFNLKAGDMVSLQNAELERDYVGDGFSSFSGFLLFEDFPISQVVG